MEIIEYVNKLPDAEQVMTMVNRIRVELSNKLGEERLSYLLPANVINMLVKYIRELLMHKR